MKKTLFLILFAIAISGAQSQTQKEKPATVLYPIDFHETRPLRDIVAEHPLDESKVYKKEESEDRENRKPQHFVKGVKKGGVYANDATSVQTRMGTTNGHAPLTNWAGQTAAGFRPMDPSGAAGLTQYVQMINATTFKVYNKTTGAVTLTATLGNLWTSPTPNDGDPIVLYDKAADRWFLAQFGSSGNKIYIAVSNTGDATGAYHTWTYTSSQFPDYLKFSVWQDGYYMTSNQGTQRIYVFERTAMIAGSATARSVTQTFSPPNAGYFFVPLPGDASDGTLPPTGTPCPIFSYSDNGWGGSYVDAVNIYKVTVNWIPSTATATITSAGSVATAAFDASYNSSWNDVSQPGTSQKLDGIGGTLMYRAQWKPWNTSGYNSVVLSWGVKNTGTTISQRSIKWCELHQNQTTGVWTMYQEGIYSPDTYTRWMSSIAMDNNGSISLCYLKSACSGTGCPATAVYPSLCYTGRRTCDPLGTLPVSEVVATAGSSSQSGTNRIGDYAQSTLDPVNGITFWHTGEYMSTGGNAATRIYSFQIAPCVTSAPVANFSATPTTICAGQTVAFTDLSTNTPTSWAWTFTGGTPTSSTSQNPTVVYSTAGNYSVTLTATNSMGNNSITMTNYITVNPVPSVTVPANITVCAGATVSASVFTSSPTGATFAWTNSNTAIGLAASGSGNVPSFTSTNATSSAITAAIIVIPTLSGCAGSPTTYTITVNPKPTITAISNITACAGSNVVVPAFASNVAGSTFGWTNSNTATGLAASGSGNIVSFIGTNTTTANIVSTISVTATSVAGCVSNATTFTITIKPRPTVTVPANITVCAGATVSASVFTSLPTGATFAWTNSNTAIGLAASGTGNVPSFTATNATASAITASIIVIPTLNGCAGAPTTYTITVNPKPTITAISNITVCAGSNVVVPAFASNVAGSTFGWTNSNTATGLAASGSGNIVSFIGTNTTTANIVSTISVTATSAAGCTSNATTFTITIKPRPTVTVPANLTVCAGATVSTSVFISLPTGATFAWTNSNTAIGLAASGTGNVPAFTTTNSTSSAITAAIIVIPTLNGCAGSPTTYTITVNPLPTVVYTQTPDTVCISIPAFALSAGSPVGGTYSGSGVTNASTGMFDPAVAGPGIKNICYDYSDVNGCVASQCYNIFIDVCTGINQSIAHDGINIFPNPSNGVFQLSSDYNLPSTIKVYDVLGQLVYKASINSNQSMIDLSKQANSIYFIQVIIEKQIVFNQKVIKQ